MQWDYILILAISGLVSGVLAGFLGIGGGTVLVPIMVALGFEPIQAVATSSLAIVVTSISGSIQNWRMGYLDPRSVIFLGFPAVVTAQVGIVVASNIPDYALLIAFSGLLLSNIYLVGLRKRVAATQHPEDGTEANLAVPAATVAPPQRMAPWLARLITGGAAGFLAGIFGVGGGVIMVPLQILLLGEKIKAAIQTSLGVIVITALSAAIGHAFAGNVRFDAGFLLGIGGLLGAQISTRFLPKLSDRVVSFSFRAMLGLLSVYIFWQAWTAFQAP